MQLKFVSFIVKYVHLRAFFETLITLLQAAFLCKADSDRRFFDFRVDNGFDSNLNMVREVKNLSPNFKQISDPF